MSSSSFKRTITFQDVLHFLSRYLKYWRLGVLGALLGVALSLAYFVYGKPSYYSKSVVEWNYVDTPIKSEISDSKGRSKWDNINVQVVSGLQSQWLAERVAMRLGLVDNISQLGSIWTRFISKVKVTTPIASHVEIEVWVYEPWLAKIWPRAMLLEYHDYLTESRIKHRDMLVDGFSKEMDRIRENLTAQSERDRQFESENQVLENYVENNQLEQLPTQMLTYRTQLDSMNEIEKFIENTAPTSSEKLALLRKYRASPLPVGTIVRRSEGPDPFVTKTSPPNVLVGETSVDISQGGSGAASKSGTALIVTPEKSNRSEAWEAIDDELRTAVHEYERLSATLLPGHERMRELKKNIDAATNALDLEWVNAMGSFGLEKAHIEQRLEDLQKQMPEYRQLIAAYDDYRRDFKLESSGRLAWEQAYVTMKARLTAMDYTGPEVQVNFLFQGFTDVRDDVPVSPNKKKLLNYALMLSVGLGLGAPFLTERMRFTSSFVTEAEKYCQYATCGVVPLLHAELLGINGYIGDRRTNARKSSHADESFRIIRNSLTFHAPAGNLAQALMVTSSRPNDGKSTIAEHLARSFAEAGERVLLLDADLRRGSLQKEFGVGASAPGLFELLAGKLVFDEVVVDTGIPNLSIVTRGLDTNRDYDLLSGKNLGQLIESLRERFDRIILDTPPMLGVADSLIIAKVVDGVLFVIRSDETTQRDIVTAAEMLHHTGAVVYGFVLNGVDFSRRENSYYYGSYYARYYEPSYYTLEHPDNSKKIPSNLDY